MMNSDSAVGNSIERICANRNKDIHFVIIMKPKIEAEHEESAENNDIEDNFIAAGENSHERANIHCQLTDEGYISSRTELSEMNCLSEESLPETDSEHSEEEENKLFVHQFIDGEGKMWNDEDKNFQENSNTSLRILRMHPLINSEYGEEEDIYVEDESITRVSECEGDPSNDQKESGDLLKRKKKRKSDFCFYCMTPVFNFSRHIQRHHKNERDVQKILAMPSGNKLRKQLLASLRKQGNYLVCKTIIKPVKSGDRFTSHLPCTNCFGFYSRKNLYRHLKKCSGNANVNTTRAQIDAQNFLLGDIAVDLDLKEKVFPRMRADNISFIAKQDLLICAYAAQYLKSHQGYHVVNVASRKMREMGKLLIELQKLDPSIKTLFSALRPENFDLLIEAAKNIARSESADENGIVSLLATNMGSALRQCCEEALSYSWKQEDQNYIILLKKDVTNLRILINLLETEWRRAIPNLIHTYVHIKKVNKVTLISLAINLKTITVYLVKVANSSIAILDSNNKDTSAYITLLETILCRLIILNRRSLNELQTLPVQLYKSTLHMNNETQEEVDRLLSKAEKVMINNFKRIIIQGNRGKVPVLFSKDIQKHLDILLKYRDSIVQKSNEYLFGNPSTSQPIRGHKLLKKYANSSDIQNPSILTYPKLKKYTATLSQLLRINEGDMVQLASFLGLILGIHISCYNLQDDFSQTARIAKLLILMEENRTADIRGKNLKNIIDLDENLMSHEINKARNVLQKNWDDVQAQLDGNEKDEFRQNRDKTQEPRMIHKENKQAKRRVIIRWTSKQKEAVETFFSEHINEKRPPRKRDCVKLKALYPELLQNKDWLKIKVYIQNKYTKRYNF